MIQQVRYQVFISSTYEDLREERQQATQAILEAGCFPSGMELFPASDDTQWELIKRVIEESDYYVVIVGGRYGSLSPSGLSFTEMEYDYAVDKGIPVLGFVRLNVGDIPFDKTEKSENGREKLDAFRKKVMSRTCRKFSAASELGLLVMKSLMSEARVRPRVGWIRADQARTDEDFQRERDLEEELKEAKELIAYLEREIRDRAVLGDEVSINSLAQGEDIIAFTVTFTNNEKRQVSERVELTWDEIFSTIGPTMYGFILRKSSNPSEPPAYPFQDNLEELVRSKIIDRAQSRKIRLQPNQVDACVLQFKELGLLMYAEKKEDDGSVFRGVTLTELGERRLTRVSIHLRSKD